MIQLVNILLTKLDTMNTTKGNHSSTQIIVSLCFLAAPIIIRSTCCHVELMNLTLHL